MHSSFDTQPTKKCRSMQTPQQSHLPLQKSWFLECNPQIVFPRCQNLAVWMQIALTLNNYAWDSGILHVALHTMGFPGGYIARKILLKWNKATNIENPKHVVCASLSSQSEISLWNVHLAKELNGEDVQSLNRNLVQKSSTEILGRNRGIVKLSDCWSPDSGYEIFRKCISLK